MDIPQFDSPIDLFNYLIENGPDVDSLVLDGCRDDAHAGQVADGIMSYFLNVYDQFPEDIQEHLFAVVRKNVRLVSGNESDLELADFVGAPWDCFA
ncbi:hypothetical protein [Corynebacterium uterequi]|uniref:hypothetical protein n=1 Tax=Corynebacterium uterequi TaxID=1072256 RepID=UPI000641543C|nr:hypothetical protein [Corynebacterium uterequi]